jgi:hypothetical protein
LFRDRNSLTRKPYATGTLYTTRHLERFDVWAAT